MDDLSKLLPIRRDGGPAAEAARPRASDENGDWTQRQPEVPWRLAVVEAWFARARQVGLDTIAERRRTRSARARGQSAG